MQLHLWGILATMMVNPEIVTPADKGTEPHEIYWHWESSFSEKEKEMVLDWLTRLMDATQSTLGDYPFPVHLHIHRRDSGEPVPWANTRRAPNAQGVDFHIDPSHPREDFLQDWTAPHELSHLSLPFLGLENAWFAEGYASFMQYQVMQDAGIIDSDQAYANYREKLSRVERYYRGQLPVSVLAKQFQEKHKYSVMYWGSASYFIQLDQLLKKTQQLSLPGLIREYQLCCRHRDRTLEEVVGSWDRLIGSPVCSDLLKRFLEAPSREVFMVP